MSKKLIAIALAGLFVFSVGSFKAFAADENVCVSIDLKYGMKDSQVSILQTQLKSDPTVYPEGLVTGYFGPLTLKAVKAFQAKYNIITTGYVGPLTRGKLTELYCPVTTTTGLPEGCTSTTGFSPTTGHSCAETVTYPEGCTSTTGFSTTTGHPCSETVTLPEGCTSTTGFSPTTGQSCAGTTTTTVAPAEGTLTVTQYPIPGTGTVTAYGGNTNKEVAAYKMKATNSDIRIKRLLAQINLTSDFPWRALTSISLWDGSTLLKEVAVNSTNLTEINFASAYQVTLDGLDVLVAKDTEKVISLKVTVPAVPQYTGDSGHIYVSLPANAVRGVDTASLNVYGPASAIATTAHYFTVSTAQQPTITVTGDTDNPLAGNVIGNSANTTRVDLLKFDVKVENVGATLKGGAVTIATTGADVLSAVELYDGSTLLSSAAPSAGTATWSTYTLPVSAGTTKVLTVKGVIKANPSSGATVAISLPATTGLTGVDDNGASLPANTAVSGNTMHVYLQAPVFTYSAKGYTVTGSNPNAGHPNDLGTASITFTVTANGGDIYIATTTTDGMQDNIGPTGPTSSDAWSCTSPAETNTSANFWRIPSGSTATCVFTDQITNTGGTPGWFQPTINHIKWMTSATTTGNIDQTWGLTTLKTDQFYLGI